MIRKQHLLAICVIALVVTLGAWWATKQYLLSSAWAVPAKEQVVVLPSPPPPPPSEDAKVVRARELAEAQKKIAEDLEVRLRDAISGWSATNIQKAKLEGRYPHDTRVRLGTSVVTAMNVDTVWVRSDDGKPLPYHIGQVIPGGGRLLAIDYLKNEAVAEQTILRVNDPVKPESSGQEPSKESAPALAPPKKSGG